MMSVSATSSKTDSLARIGGEEGVKEVFTINDDAGNQYKQADNVDLLNGAKRLKSAAKTSTPTKARGATYDGNVCLICGDKASGLHYGVLACEGCKGFFKRVCKEKLVCPPPQPDDGDASQKRQCLFGGNCEINMRTRNRCQYCRIQKCVELGMSKDGIKLGRRSKNFKQNLDNHQQASNKLFDSKNGLATSGLNLLAGASPAMPQEPGKQLIGIIQDNALIFKTVDVISTTSAVKLEHGLALKSDLTQQPSLSNAAQSVLPTSHNGSLMPTLILNNTPSAILMINAPQSTTSQTTESKDSNQSSPYPILIYQQQPSTSSSLSQPQVATSSSSSAQPLTTANPSPTTTDSGGSVSESTSIYSMLNESEISNIVQATYQAYKETAFDYQSDGESAETPIEQLIEAQGHEALKYLFSKGVIEFLRGSKFLDHFNILIENAVLFAKNTPYFMNINETDRITLLKSCVFQVICVRHANYFYSSSSSSNQSALNQKPMPSQEEIVELATYALITPASHTDRFLIPIYNSYVTRAWFAQHLPRLSTLINLLFDFYRHFQLYELTDTERSLFCAYLLFNTDNSTLVDFSDLNNYRELFGDIFLNTLVNKLTSSKQTTISSRQIRAWMSESYAKLKQIDVEHAKLLNEYKPFIVWPDLYSELYNL